MEIYAEIADRAGADEFFIPAVCGLYRVKEEYMFHGQREAGRGAVYRRGV